MRYKSVAKFVEERSGAPWDDAELSSVVLSECPTKSDLYKAADKFQSALADFEAALIDAGFERG